MLQGNRSWLNQIFTAKLLPEPQKAFCRYILGEGIGNVAVGVNVLKSNLSLSNNVLQPKMLHLNMFPCLLKAACAAANSKLSRTSGNGDIVPPLLLLHLLQAALPQQTTVQLSTAFCCECS